MQISGPSKWLNKLKRPQGPGQLVTPPSPLSTFNCVLFFKYLLLSNIETISKCENARQMAPLHVRHHAHAHTYIGLDIRMYIYTMYGNILLSCTLRECCQGTRCDAPDTDTPWNYTLSFAPRLSLLRLSPLPCPTPSLFLFRVNGFRHGFSYAFECYTICNLSFIIFEIYQIIKRERVHWWYFIH